MLLYSKYTLPPTLLSPILLFEVLRVKNVPVPVRRAFSNKSILHSFEIFLCSTPPHLVHTIPSFEIFLC
jgi:hypothetical protein